jgi:hypothetical protein
MLAMIHMIGTHHKYYELNKHTFKYYMRRKKRRKKKIIRKLENFSKINYNENACIRIYRM